MRLNAMPIRLLTLSGVLLFLTACGDSQREANLLVGQEIVKQNCKVCHAQGINGAPIIGNSKMWSSRIGKGRDALVSNAITGNGLMPPKGGKSALTDAEIDLAVGYMLSQINSQ